MTVKNDKVNISKLCGKPFFIGYYKKRKSSCKTSDNIWELINCGIILQRMPYFNQTNTNSTKNKPQKTTMKDAHKRYLVTKIVYDIIQLQL